MTRLHSLLILCCIILVACSQPQPSSTPNGLYPESPLKPLLSSIGPVVHTFAISTDRDTTVVTPSGNSYTISANSLVDANGQPVSSATLQIAEATTTADIVAANLTTTSDGQLLQTGGMVFMVAQSNGKPVSLAPNKSVFVQMPQSPIGPMQIFYGTHNTKGEINWAVDRDTATMSLRDGAKWWDTLFLVIRPFSVLPATYSRNCIDTSDVQISEIRRENGKYAKTYFATREFFIRWHLACFYQKPWGDSLNRAIIDLYKSNVSHSLYYADSMVYEYWKEANKQYKSYCFSEGWDLKESCRWDGFMGRLVTKPLLDFDNLGITSSTTIKQLMAKGRSREEAIAILQLYATQQQYAATEKAYRVFEIKKFGWVNVDMFLNDSLASESDFAVHVTGAEPPSTVLTLVIPQYNVFVGAHLLKNGMFSFTDKGDSLYRKLPVGKSAYLVALNYSKAGAKSSITRIVIPKTGLMNVELKDATTEKIRKALTSITK